MGLRQLYFIIGGLMQKMVYLTEGLSIILGFIGIKLVFEAFHYQEIDEIAGIHIPEISLGTSLGVILGVLSLTAALSLHTSRKKSAKAA